MATNKKSSGWVVLIQRYTLEEAGGGDDFDA